MWTYLGCCYFMLGMYQEAEKVAQKGRRQDCSTWSFVVKYCLLLHSMAGASVSFTMSGSFVILLFMWSFNEYARCTLITRQLILYSCWLTYFTDELNALIFSCLFILIVSEKCIEISEFLLLKTLSLFTSCSTVLTKLESYIPGTVH